MGNFLESNALESQITIIKRSEKIAHRCQQQPPCQMYQSHSVVYVYVSCQMVKSDLRLPQDKLSPDSLSQWTPALIIFCLDRSSVSAEQMHAFLMS